MTTPSSTTFQTDSAPAKPTTTHGEGAPSPSCDTQGLREVRLYGKLGRLFGRVHWLDIQSPAEAVRALCANFPDFGNTLLECAPAYRVTVGTDEVGEDDLGRPCGVREVIRIVPVIGGATSGFAKIIVGAAIFAVGFFSSFFGISAPIGTALMGAGLSMMMGGAMQLLSPMPKLGGPNELEQKPSYAFSGATNVSAQGAAIPIGYGRLIVGSVVLSASMTTEDYSDTSLSVTQWPNGNDAIQAGPYTPQPGDATYTGDNNIIKPIILPPTVRPAYTYPQAPGDGDLITGDIVFDFRVI